jgi:hypothetical protein
MSGRNALDSLRGRLPVSDSAAAAVFGIAGREELLAGVTRLPFGRRGAARPTTRRRRRLVVAVAAVALAGIATAATWAALRSSPARETTSIQCLIKGSDAIIPSFSGNPVHDCAAGWRQEYRTAPPRLRAYDNGLGGVTVIPASRKPPAGWKPLRSQDVSLIELQNSLDDYIAGLNSSCLDSTAATNLAKAKLARFGFAGWTVDVRDGGTASPGECYDQDIVDPSTSTVTLASFGGVAGPGSTFQKLADKLRPITQSCESLPHAVAAVRTAAASLGLAESAKTYTLEAATDNSLRCTSIYETVGGTIFLTVRGPTG